MSDTTFTPTHEIAVCAAETPGDWLLGFWEDGHVVEHTSGDPNQSIVHFVDSMLAVIGVYLINKSPDQQFEFGIYNIASSVLIFFMLSLAIFSDAVLSMTRSLAPPSKKIERASVVKKKHKSSFQENIYKRFSSLISKRTSSVSETSSTTTSASTESRCSKCLVKCSANIKWLVRVYQEDFSYETGIFYLEVQLVAECMEVGSQIYQLYEFSQTRDVLYVEVVCVLLILQSGSMLLPVLLRCAKNAERTAKNIVVLCDTILDVTYFMLALYFLSACQFETDPLLSTVSIALPAVFTVDKLRDVVEYTRNQVSEKMLRDRARKKRSIRKKNSTGNRRRRSTVLFQRGVPSWIKNMHKILSIIGALVTIVFAGIFFSSANQGYVDCERALGTKLWLFSYPKVVIPSCRLDLIAQIQIPIETPIETVTTESKGEGMGEANDGKIRKLPDSMINLTALRVLDLQNQSIEPNGIPWRVLDGTTLSNLTQLRLSGNPV